MTSPVVSAIQAVARLHLNRQDGLQQRRRIAVQMYVEQDQMWLAMLAELDQRIAEESTRAQAAANDAAAIAREERGIA